MGHLVFVPSDIDGLFTIERTRIRDQRGFFSRLFCSDELSDYGLQYQVRQINHTYTKTAGTIRGMHFQMHPHNEAKIVTCTRGSIFDVAVDLRPKSRHFGEWRSIVLDSLEGKSYFIPRGFAHGFQALEPDSEIVYLHDADYVPAADAGINPLDTSLSIEWPMPPKMISDKDKALPVLQGIKDSIDGV